MYALNKTCICALLIQSFFSIVDPANILGIFLVPSISHQRIFQPIYRELALRGHNLTIITPDPLKDPTLTNLLEIDLHDRSYEVWDKHNIAKLGVNEEIDSSDMTPFLNLLEEMMDVQMSVPEFKEIINQDLKHFDMILGEMMLPTVYPFIDLCNCPMVGISSLPLLTITHNLLGNPAHPIVSPDVNLPFSRNLDFWERFQSVTYYIAMQFLYQKIQEPMTKIINKHFGPTTRDLMELMTEVDLVLANVNPVLIPPRPNIPAVVEFHGVHIQPPKKLPQDIERFLDNATDGAIYISFGSNIKSSFFPKQKIDIFLAVISNMPFKFIWKFEADHTPNMPANLLVSSWLPQQDILRHPSVKLFITQGGLQSWEESLYAKVPVVIIPFFGDQHGNARKIEQIGMGRRLNFHDLTKEKLQNVINEVTSNETYKLTTIKLYELATDQPMTGLDKAIWWIEYTLRHNGAKHLRSPASEIPAYQYYMLDVAAFVIGVVIIVLVLTIALFRLLYKIVVNFRRKIKSD